MSARNTANNDGIPVHGLPDTLPGAICQKPMPVIDCGMNRNFVNDICAALPGAEVSDPWGGGHDAWKIGGKMFASIGTIDTGVSVKTADIETAQLIIEMGRGTKAAYFHKSWVHLPWDMVNADELTERLHTSYRIIRGGLTKKFQASLAPFDDQA